MKSYFLSDACEVVKLTPGRIQNWMAAGWITPSRQVARGSGTRNIFSHSDIVVIEMLRIMIDMGIPRKYAGQVAMEFQNSETFKQYVLESSGLEISYFEIFVVRMVRYKTPSDSTGIRWILGNT